MSTSPSWFDQEKFTRLVKKVGTRPLPEVVSKPPGPPVENPPQGGEGLAPTARISLVSRPPSLLSEHRALPALPRRTGPMPSMRAVFQPPASTPPVPPVEPTESAPTESKETPPEVTTPTDGAKPEAETGAPSGQEEDDDSDLTALWQKMALLNEELARANQERDHALHESEILRQQLHKADGTSESPGAPSDELARLTKERDEARAEAQALRAKLPGASTTDQPGGFSKTKEIGFLSTERDQARKEYAELRKQYEDLKREQSPKEDSAKFRKELEQQVEGFRVKLEERNKEIAALKANTAAGGGNAGPMQEVETLREELARAKTEASVAQRGLALSQKALHETRDALREATEGTSMSRHNFDNLKKECATLTQQNTVLQAQNDQLTRELAATRSKMTTRL